MDQLLEGCPGTLGISDDVCVFGRTEEEHDNNLLRLMEVSRAKGLVFNSAKCSIKKPQIGFYGLIWDERGVHPDPAKCDNIKEKTCTYNSERTPTISGHDSLALLSLRTTPIDNLLPSPAELLFNRKVQSQVPHILRHSNRSEDIRQHLQQKQSVQKAYFDRQARELPPLLEHQQVSVQDTNTGLWSPATIVKETEEPRRYLIETPDGTTLRRNRLHLKDSARTRPAKPPPQADDDEAGDSAASATEGESVCRSSDSIPDPQATEYITDLRPGSSNPPGPMIEKPSTSVRNNRLHTRSGRTIKPPKRYVDE
ncbi:polyprotein p3 [Plakobranchus ocellatus]|uniref:Polyprotein p3 n=1 Tax=Plakobranchus ocellatus TaxID=259542 RepID=A0AAV3YFZ9_9GAST|nr:polyprotein p3 [Plakobranchus ocellatus]